MSAQPMCDDTRNDSQPLATCPVCGTEFQPIGRGRFCTPHCRQTAYRLRHRQVDRVTLADIAERLLREHRLLAQTVYECSSCQERLLGERRCNSCNLMCRKVGTGGECGGCGEIVTISELLAIVAQVRSTSAAARLEFWTDGRQVRKAPVRRDQSWAAVHTGQRSARTRPDRSRKALADTRVVEGAVERPVAFAQTLVLHGPGQAIAVASTTNLGPCLRPWEASIV